MPSPWTKLVDSSHGRAKEPSSGKQARGGRFCMGCGSRIYESYTIVDGKFKCEECFELDTKLARMRTGAPRNDKEAKRRANLARKRGMKQRESRW